KRSIGFGDLTKGRKLTETIRADVAPQPATEWTIARTSVPKADARDIVTGKHQYTSDMRLPGMLYGRVLRTAGVGPSIANVDMKGTSAIKGAVAVRDGTFIGVAARTSADAERALTALDTTWAANGMTLPSSATVYEHLKRTATTGAGRQAGGEGG